MTLQDSKLLFFSGSCPCSEHLAIAVQANYVCPEPADNISHHRSEVPSSDFNGLSCQDVMISSQFRYCDSLHKPDMIAAKFNQATRTKSAIKKVGFDRFVSTYKK